jgi:hypothetical protein
MKLISFSATGLITLVAFGCGSTGDTGTPGDGGLYSNTGATSFGGGGAGATTGAGGATASSGGTGFGSGGTATGSGASPGNGGSTTGNGGSNQGNAGSGGVPSGSGGATIGIAGAGGAGGSSCQASSGAGACEKCSVTSCCAEQTACKADAGCSSALATFYTCLDQATASGGEPDACDQAFTNGTTGSPADNLATCVHGGCSTPCQ